MTTDVYNGADTRTIPPPDNTTNNQSDKRSTEIFYLRAWVSEYYKHSFNGVSSRKSTVACVFVCQCRWLSDASTHALINAWMNRVLFIQPHYCSWFWGYDWNTDSSWKTFIASLYSDHELAKHFVFALMICGSLLVWKPLERVRKRRTLLKFKSQVENVRCTVILYLDKVMHLTPAPEITNA